MPQADIEINGVAASDEDLPIDILVQLSNNDAGDETTYLWSIISEPPGTSDVLSSTIIENPTITPKKEDTYLVQLIVDQGLPGEATDRKLFRIRRLKTDATLIAVAETVEGTDSAWAIPQNETLDLMTDRMFGGEVMIAQASGVIVAGSTVEFDEVNTIKATLPGEERVPRVTAINATDASIAAKATGIAISQPNGSTTIVGGDMVLVRITGLLDIAQPSGSPAIAAPVFVSDTGSLALTPGTNRKRIGRVIDDTVDAWKAFILSLDEENTDFNVRISALDTTTGFLEDKLVSGTVSLTKLNPAANEQLRADLGSLTKAQLDAAVSDGDVLYVGDATTPSLHALGGAEHSASTLASLNSKVSDADLIATVDSRLSDTRLPRDYATAISIARSTTTLTAYQTKTTLVTGALTGTYRVAWVATVDIQSTSQLVYARLQTGAVTVGTEKVKEAKDLLDKIVVSGFAESVFTGFSKTFEIQWRSSGGATIAGIEDARIEIWRVA